MSTSEQQKPIVVKFTGDASLTLLPPAAHVALVEFEDGAITYWHTHSEEQVLAVLKGRGWLQYRGEEKLELNTGDLVRVRPKTEHWHGARAGESMSQLALSGGKTEWGDEVEPE